MKLTQTRSAYHTILTLTLIYFSQLAVANTPPNFKLNLTQSKSKISFLAVGKPAIIKIRGKCNTDHPVAGDFEIKGSNISGKATLKMKHLETGIGLRDRHMKETYLEIKKFPDAVLELKKLPLSANLSQAQIEMEDVPFEGLMHLHGKSRTVKGTVDITGSLTGLELEFEFSLLLPEFDIKVPEYLGITVAKKVEVKVQILGKVEPL